MALDRCQCPLTHAATGGECPQFLPVGHSPKRKYCDDCPKGAHRRQPSERSPVSVTVKIPTGTAKVPKGDPTQQKVAEAATAWLGMAAVILEASGDATCAKAVTDATPQIAAQLALLSKYHPIIVKVLAPVEASGEVLVWISLVVAVSPVLLTVLAHHNLISEKMGERLGVVAMMGAVVGQAPTPPQPDDAPSD